MHGRGGCAGVRTVHHIREYGSARDDYRTVTLCAAHHIKGCGPNAVHELGRRGWQAKFGIDFDAEIERYNEQWRASGNEIRAV